MNELTSRHDHFAPTSRTLLVLYGLVLAGFVVPRLAVEPYDDSYFFKRVAVNLLDRGKLAWNVDEGPVYGLTSQTFQLITTAVVALARDHYVLGIRIVLALCLLLACRQMLVLTKQWDSGISALYTLCSPVVLYMTLSGMETAFLMALLAGYLLLLHAPTGAKQPFWIAPVAAICICLTRPDAAVLVGPTLIYERYRANRRPPWREALVVTVGLLLACSLLRLAYGTFLPLPFYAKTSFFSPYDAHFLELSRQVKHVRFGLWLAVALPLLWLAVRCLDGTNLVLLASVLVFESYLFTTVVEVMGMQGRFYAPALPLLCMAAARGARIRKRHLDRPGIVVPACTLYLGVLYAMSKVHWLPHPDDWWMDTVDPWFAGATILSGGVVILCPLPLFKRDLAAVAVTVASLGASLSSAPRIERHALDDDAYLSQYAAHVTTYRGMDALRHCIGERIHVYHSEVGVTGLRFQAGKVTDLAGLWSPRWLFRKSGSFDQFCNADRPEAIFLPHKNYARLNREILSGTCIRNYERVVEDSSSPLYVRKDLVSRYMRCPEATEWR